MVMRMDTDASRVISVDAKVIDSHLEAFNVNLKLLLDISHRHWKPTADFLASGGPSLMLDIIQATPGER